MSDYKLNVIVPDEIADFFGFQSDLGKLLEVFKNSGDEESMNMLFKKDTYKSVSIAAVDMMNTFLGIRISKDTVNAEGEIDMCKAWEDHYNSGIEQGIEQGRIDAIHRMLKGSFSKEQILGLGYSEDEYAEAEQALVSLV